MLKNPDVEANSSDSGHLTSTVSASLAQKAEMQTIYTNKWRRHHSSGFEWK